MLVFILILLSSCAPSAQEYLDQANALYETGETDKALAQLELAIEASPSWFKLMNLMLEAVRS